MRWYASGYSIGPAGSPGLRPPAGASTELPSPSTASAAVEGPVSFPVSRVLWIANGSCTASSSRKNSANAPACRRKERRSRIPDRIIAAATPGTRNQILPRVRIATPATSPTQPQRDSVQRSHARKVR